jgi:hypothetical protein
MEGADMRKDRPATWVKPHEEAAVAQVVPKEEEEETGLLADQGSRIQQALRLRRRGISLRNKEERAHTIASNGSGCYYYAF